MSDSTPMEQAMSVPTASSLATGKTRVHRMMRRAEMVRRKRDAVRRAQENAIRLDNIPFWRWRKRAQIEAEILRLRERAAMYAETAGETNHAD